VGIPLFHTDRYEESGTDVTVYLLFVMGDDFWRKIDKIGLLCLVFFFDKLRRLRLTFIPVQDKMNIAVQAYNTEGCDF